MPVPPEETIEFKGHSDRFLIFISEEIQTVKLCGLEKGETYLVNAMPAGSEDKLFSTFLNLGDMSYGKVKPTSPCYTLVIKTTSAKALDKEPVYISVSKTSETYSVKPPGEIGRPPAISTATGLPPSDLITDVLIGGDCFEVSNVTSQGDE
ncbi:MAG: hypothetical protein IPG32_08650 [Saprospirales bacterium]|nr:hypothetical protein [Saprospirales bacterium]